MNRLHFELLIHIANMEPINRYTFFKTARQGRAQSHDADLSQKITSQNGFIHIIPNLANAPLKARYLYPPIDKPPFSFMGLWHWRMPEGPLLQPHVTLQHGIFLKGVYEAQTAQSPFPIAAK